MKSLLFLMMRQKSLLLFRFVIFFILCSFFFLTSTDAISEYYIPENEYEILEVLPKTLTPLLADMEKLQAQYNVQPKNKELLKKLIGSYLEQATIVGDMRYVSYAQATLKPWLSVYPDDEVIRFLNIKIQQQNHRFYSAMKALKHLLSDYPGNVEAWSLLANLQLLTGDHENAKQSCRKLSIKANLVDSVICQSNIMIRLGFIKKAEKSLKALLVLKDKNPAKNILWIYASLAEIALQKNDTKNAQLYIDKANHVSHKHNVHDNYLKTMQVDFLIYKKNFIKAYDLVKDEKNNIALKVRATMLAKKLKYKYEFNERKIAVIRDFEVEKRRGAVMHLREYAWFLLLVMNDPEKAIDVAIKNWTSQKELEDARLLMTAAVATKNNMVIERVKRLLVASKIVDRRLDLDELYKLEI